LSTPARQSPGCNSTEARDAGVYAFGEIERLVRDWNLHLRNISKTASVAGQLDAFRRKVGIPLSFSAGPGSVELPKELPRLENREGLCGTDISVFTKSLDASAISGKGILKGDLVLEIDPDGKVLRQWTTEYNWVSVEAVRG